MNENKAKRIAKDIYYLSEDMIYDVIDRVRGNKNIDETLTYIYIKALFMHCIQKYYAIKNNQEDFNQIYEAYKNNLKEYYVINNAGIQEEMLADINQMFENSYQFMETTSFKNINDSYEFRHHIIDCMELLRKILEKKSKDIIRVDLFDNDIRKIKDKADEIIDYVMKEG